MCCEITLLSGLVITLVTVEPLAFMLGLFVCCQISLCSGLVITLVAEKPLTFMFGLFVFGHAALLNEGPVTFTTGILDSSMF